MFVCLFVCLSQTRCSSSSIVEVPAKFIAVTVAAAAAREFSIQFAPKLAGRDARQREQTSRGDSGAGQLQI